MIFLFCSRDCEFKQTVLPLLCSNEPIRAPLFGIDFLRLQLKKTVIDSNMFTNPSTIFTLNFAIEFPLSTAGRRDGLAAHRCGGSDGT